MKARARAGNLKEDETTYLDPLVKIAKTGETMGEFTVRWFLKEMDGDTKALFEECKY